MLHWDAAMLATSRAEHAHTASATVNERRFTGNVRGPPGGALSRLSSGNRPVCRGVSCTRAEATGGGTPGTLGNLAHSTQLESTVVVAAVSATRMRAVMKVDLQVEKVEFTLSLHS